jgi:hypothetical protein
VIHNYRWRLGLAEGEPKYAEPEKRLAAGPVISVPTITIEVIRTERRIRSRVLMRRNSPANMSTGRSRAALDTTCRKKRRRRLQKQLSTLTVIDLAENKT